MSGRRAVLAGASGFLGPLVAADLTHRGQAVAVVGRNGPDAPWDQRDRLAALVDGAGSTSTRTDLDALVGPGSAVRQKPIPSR